MTSLQEIKTEKHSIVLSSSPQKIHSNHLVFYTSGVFKTDVSLKHELVDAHIAKWGTVPNLQTALGDYYDANVDPIQGVFGTRKDEFILTQALGIYATAIGLNYEAWQNFHRYPSTTDQQHEDRIKLFYHGIEFIYGKKYIKVVKGGSVHSFIVIDDDTVKDKGCGYFKRGDILKAASWSAPAKNFPRGNILDSWYRTTWY